MTAARDVALAWLRAFCAGDVDAVAALLAPDVHFRGPLHRSDSAAEYVDSLRRDPPERCDCRIHAVIADGEDVAIFYDYLKPAGPVTIAQHFRIRDGLVAGTRLVFDGRRS